MPNRDWEFDLDWTYQVDVAIEDGAADVCIGTAYRALEFARDAVPQVSHSRGYATDALRDSGYVISRVKGRIVSGYGPAINAAKSHPDSRIAERDQIMSRFPIEMFSPSLIIAVLDFPLTYASLIQEGFHHVGSGQFIIGSDFIQSAMNAVGDEFDVAMSRVVSAALTRQSRLKLSGF